MRTFKFRGKTCKDGKWVYGSYLESTRSWGMEKRKPTKCWIIEDSMTRGGFIALLQRYPVQEKTVGQFTGLVDKNGKEIYEGDMLVLCDEDHRSQPIIVVFKYGSFGYIYSDDWFRTFAENSMFTFNPLNTDIHFEVIGNIHDNPELLKGE